MHCPAQLQLRGRTAGRFSVLLRYAVVLSGVFTLSVFAPRAANAQALGEQALGDEVAFTYARGEMRWSEFDAFLGRLHRQTPEGQRALEHLIKRDFVAAEAKRRGMSVTQAAWSAFLTRHRQDLKQRGLGTLEGWLAQEGIDVRSFERFARIDLLLEMLVREDLRLGRDAVPSPAQSQIWLADKSSASARAVSRERSDLVARIEGRDIDLTELGRTVRSQLDREELLKMSRDAAVEATVAAEGRRRGIALDAAALAGELQRMREELAEHPRLSHLPFAEYLKQLGHDEKSLLSDPNFRSRALLYTVVRSQRDDAAWRAHYLAQREAFDRSLGERRLLAWILCRGAAEANSLVHRTLPQAEEVLRGLRTRIGADFSFADAARIYSDDDRTKEFDGRLGWLTRLSTRAEARLLEKAFELGLNVISEPVRTRDGYALIQVLGIEAAPQEADMVERVIRYEVSRERAGLLRQLKIQPKF